MPEAIRFYLDEHVASAVASGLRRRGVDVVTAQEANMLGICDADHVALATGSDRVVFTQDADFLRLHAAGIHHAGIAYAPQQTPVGAIVRGLMLIYQVLDAEDMSASAVCSTAALVSCAGKTGTPVEATDVVPYEHLVGVLTAVHAIPVKRLLRT